MNVLVENTYFMLWSCAQQIDLEFELKYQKTVGDMMSALIPDVVDPLLQYAAQRGSRSVRDVAATALGKTTGFHAMLCGLQLSMLA